jgi:EAL domain-containing protein (putative c-di-GMP-specific phosphodiesterase class I)
MDEPVRHLVEGDLDFSPQCSDVRQLMDSSFLIEQDLAEALRLRTLRVEYQPQFDLSNGQGCGVEALARWVRSTGEIIAPSVFIRLAERSGLIRTLGEWVLQSACATAGAWCSRPAQQTTLSVNVSALQIDEEFCGVIERTLKKTGFPAKQLELEITESALMADPALSIDYLKAWKQLGVRIAMDDFGTGYSSLSSLSRLPVDRLKLDRSLIHRMTLDSKGCCSRAIDHFTRGGTGCGSHSGGRRNRRATADVEGFGVPASPGVLARTADGGGTDPGSAR